MQKNSDSVPSILKTGDEAFKMAIPVRRMHVVALQTNNNRVEQNINTPIVQSMFSRWVH